MGRGCLFVGVPGRSDDDDAYVRAAIAAAPPGSRPFVFTAGRVTVELPRGALFEPRMTDPSMAGVTVHIVGADNTRGGSAVTFDSAGVAEHGLEPEAGDGVPDQRGVFPGVDLEHD